MLTLDLTKKAISFLEKLPPKQFRQIVKQLFKLMADPEPHDSKKLVGYEFRRTDIGEYRIVYSVAGEVIKIAVIGKRNDNDVYKKLKRL